MAGALSSIANEMLDPILARTGWTMSADGLEARLPMNRWLPAVLLVLAAAGGAMYAYFLAVADGPFSATVYVVPAILAVVVYLAIRALLSVARVSFRDGVFRCSSGALGLRPEVQLSLGDLAGFAAQGPRDHKDVPHVVAIGASGPLRLPLSVADASPTESAWLAPAVAAALNEMLDRARRARPGYR
jgi:hypothetical protein